MRRRLELEVVDCSIEPASNGQVDQHFQTANTDREGTQFIELYASETTGIRAVVNAQAHFTVYMGDSIARVRPRGIDLYVEFNGDGVPRLVEGYKAWKRLELPKIIEEWATPANSTYFEE